MAGVLVMATGLVPGGCGRVVCLDLVWGGASKDQSARDDQC